MGTPDALITSYPIISSQVGKDEIRVVLKELETILKRGIGGAVVEFGCYLGTTSLFIRRLLDTSSQGIGRAFHVYDSFAGLPPKNIADASIAGEGFRTGELAVSKRQFKREFQKAGLRVPEIHKGWFNELSAADVPDQIAFAFLDGDFYDSILSSLRLVWPNMCPGGIVLIDDYGRSALPGVERAVRDFYRNTTMPDIRVSKEIAIIKH